MKTTILVLASVCVGCGSGSETARGPLESTQWTMPAGGGFSCDFGVRFEVDSYTWLLGCTLNDGSFGAMIETGDYAVNGTSLSLRTRSASCAGSILGSLTVKYAVSPSMFSMVDPSGSFTFVPLPTGPVMPGSAALGCIADDGTFTPGQLAPL